MEYACAAMLYPPHINKRRGGYAAHAQAECDSNCMSQERAKVLQWDHVIRRVAFSEEDLDDDCDFDTDDEEDEASMVAILRRRRAVYAWLQPRSVQRRGKNRVAQRQVVRSRCSEVAPLVNLEIVRRALV
eukprot:6210275-Pleurochrysis_carterae.AAC.1